MTGQCSQQLCHPDSGCILGEAVLTSCKNWAEVENRQQPAEKEHSRCTIPWSGSAFGLDDIRLVAGRERPRVVALIGPHNAGKTTYLAALHLLCLRRQIVSNLCFSGSWTLGGWERIADFLRYPKENSPSYPPHTPVSTDRTPGLLHYDFRGSDGRVQSVLFTDAPGEWFMDWSIDPIGTQFPGASWTVERADVFLFFVDREALAGPDRGSARHKIKTLSARLAEHVKGRPFGVVWSKSDVAVDPEIEKAVQEVLKRHFPFAENFRTRFKQPQQEPQDLVAPLVESFKFSIKSREVINTFAADLSPQMTNDRFLAYRGGSDA